MSAKPDAAVPDAAIPDAGDPVKARFAFKFKNKKMILLGGIAVIVLALIGAGAWFYFGKKPAAGSDGTTELTAEQMEDAALAAEDKLAAKEEAKADVVDAVEAGPKHPPSFLPLDNMVVNLADPGGEKIAQIGITLEVVDAKALEKVRLYLPNIRSAILLLVSQRKAEELLRREGKDKLAADILREASRPFSGGPAGLEGGPVRGVLFSSFIVQ